MHNFSIETFAQDGVQIDYTTLTTRDPRAILQLNSSNQGFLVPRVASTGDVGIPSTTGLLVYQTNSPAGFYYYNGTAWVMIANTSGGIVTADNGLNVNTGNNVRLGGTISVNPTNIALAGNALTFSGVSSSEVSIGTTTPSGVARLYVQSSSSAFDAINAMHLSSSTTGAFAGIKGEIVHANYISASGQLGYHTVNNNTYGVYGNAGDYGGVFARPVSISSVTPTSTSNDLEVRNITGGNPVQVFLRQGVSNITSGTVLGNLDFGDNNTSTGQARIQITRDAPSSGSSDLPTAISFSTISDNTSTLLERMRIANTGEVRLLTSSTNIRGYLQAVESGTNNGAGGGSGLILSTSGGENIAFKDNGLAGDVNMTIVGTSGNVGIGTTNPVQRLEVSGNARLTALASGASGAVVKSNTAGDLSITNFSGTSTDVLNGAGNFVGISTISGDDWTQSGNYLYPNTLGWNVGIGTSAPGSKLQVVESGLNTHAAQIIHTNANNSNGLNIQTQTAIAADFALRVVPNAGAMDAFIVRNTGNVGVGTTSPQAKLHVSADAAGGEVLIGDNWFAPALDAATRVNIGNTAANTVIKIGQTTNNYGSLLWNYNATANNGYFQIFTVNNGSNGGNLVLQETAGNVGIGYNSPAYTLQIGQNTAANNINYNVAILRHGDLTTPGTYSGGTPALQIWDVAADGPATLEATGLVNIAAPRIADADANSANAMLLSVSNDNGYALTVKGNRNVGIGTNAPAQRLEVSGNTRITGLASGASGAIVRSNTSGDLAITNFSGSASDVLTGAGTFVGISTISGDDWTQTGSLLYPNNTAWNVGIGTTAPAFKLDVTGNARIGNTGGLTIASLTASRVNLRPSIGNGDILISDDSGTAARGLTVANGGSVGIGTDVPASLLSVGTTSQFQVNTAGDVRTISNVTPTNGAIRLNNNFLINAASGYATIINFDNGTTGVTRSFVVGDGASGTGNFYVYADGQAFTANWWRSLGSTGWYSQSWGGGIWMDNATHIKTYGDKHFYIVGDTKTLRVDGLKTTTGTYNSASTAATSNLVYANNSTGDVYALPTVNSATLVTNSSGVPSWLASTGTGVQGYWTRSGTLLYNTNQGDNTGIGTTAPGARFEVRKDNGGNAFRFANYVDGSSLGAWVGNYGAEFRTVSSGTTHGMLINHQEALDGRRTLDISDANGVFATFTNGKMGMGTLSPPTRLSIASGEADFTTGMSFGRTATSNGKYVLTNSDNQVFRIAFASNTGTTHADYVNRMVIDANGNVGVGNIAPNSFKVQVAGDVGPNADLTYNLGSSSLRWNNLYVNNISGPGALWTRSSPYLYNTTLTDNVGIGTSTPDRPLTVVNNSEWNIATRSTNATASNRNHFLAQRANGTSAVTANFDLGGIAMGGYDGSSYSLGWNGGAEITAFASQTWTAANRGTYLTFGTTADNTATISERVRITSNGNMGIGTGGPGNNRVYSVYSPSDGATDYIGIRSDVSHSGTVPASNNRFTRGIFTQSYQGLAKTDATSGIYNYGVESYVYTDGTRQYNSLRGAHFTAMSSSTATTQQEQIMGSLSQAYHNGASGTVDNVWGAYNIGFVNNSGNITQIFGSQNIAQLTGSGSGGTSNAYGAYNYISKNVNNTGTITNGYGTFSNVYNSRTSGTDKVTNAYAYYGTIGTASGGAAPTTSYGIYLDNSSGTTRWGIYTTNEQKNYFSNKVGIATTVPTESLSVGGGVVSSPGSGQSLTLGGAITTANFQVKRDFATFNSTAGVNTDIHIKTNITWVNTMYRIVVEGYNYGAALPIFSEAVGYTYAPVPASITNAATNNYASGATISQYKSSDGYVVIKLSNGSSFYYAGFSVSAWLTNPAGNAFDIKALTIVQQSSNL